MCFPRTNLTRSSRAYIEANRELDAKLARRKREKREIAAGVVPLDAETALDTSIRTFFEDVKAEDIEAVKSRPRPAKPGDGRFRKWNPKYASASPTVSPAWRHALVICTEAAITL